jgi:hypothetical protein
MTETPPFARKPDHAIQTACTAMDAKETPRQYSAVEERTKFAFHKLRNVPIALALPGEKGFQMSGDHLI